MYRKKRVRSKQKSQEIIQRLYKQLDVTYKTLNRLQRVLPGYLSFPYEGWRYLEMYVCKLEGLKQILDTFPDDPPQQ